MNSRATYIISVMLTLILSPSLSYSDWDLASGFYFTVPSQAVDKEIYEILHKNSDLSFPIADQTLNLGLNVVLSGMTGHVAYTVQNFATLTSGKNWKFDSGPMSAEIDIGQINASQTIEEVIDGVRVQLRLDAVCSQIKLTLPVNSASFSGGTSLAVKGNQLGITIDPFLMSWKDGAWQIGPVSCTGANGFGQLVTNQLNLTLSQPQSLQTVLKNFLQAQINQTLTGGLNKLFSGVIADTGRSDVLLNLQASLLIPIAGGYQLSGLSHLNLPAAFPAQHVTESLASFPAPTELGTSGLSFLTFPESLLTSFLGHIHQTQIINHQFTSDDYSPIKNLIHSFFEKLFVLPDLFHFSKRAVFNFQTSSQTPITFIVDDSSKTVTKNISGKAMGNFINDVFAPKNGQFIPYLRLKALIKSLVSFQIANGQLLCTLTPSNVKILSEWDKNYVRVYKPNTYVNKGALANSLKNSLDAKPFSYQLPVLKWTQNNLIQAVQLDHSPATKTVNIYFDSK